jgi:Icc-related predicted phosphoesterase
MRYLLILLLTACGAPEFSPWQTNTEYNDLTAKHLAWLDSIDGEFEPFTVGISGDPQAVVGHLRRVIDITNIRSDIKFLTILGDITDLGLRREWIWVGDSIEQSNKPVLTVVGNHDGLSNGHEIYKKMFGAFNYSFTHKDVKFVMWNNNLYEWGQPDFEWLQHEVESHHRVVVMSHQPPYSGTLTDEHEDRWLEIRRNTNMIASLHGHVHHGSLTYEDNLPIYTVDRVTGSHYGTMTIHEDHVTFEDCVSICGVVK